MDPDPELKKFKAGSGSGINHAGSGSGTLVYLEYGSDVGNFLTLDVFNFVYFEKNDTKRTIKQKRIQNAIENRSERPSLSV